MKKIFGIGLLCLAFACQKPAGKSGAAKNKFSDENLRALYTLQDERNATGLLGYFNSPIINYRKEAALAFGSLQDKAAVPALGSLLTDPEPPVRKAAAYALGQIADSTAETHLISAIDKETDHFVRATMFEALGKCATRSGLAILTYFDTPDTVTQAGQAWGLYRAMLRKPLPETALNKATRFLMPEQAFQVRLAAAQTLARSGKADLRRYFPVIQKAARNDKSIYVRAAAASALGKAKMPESAELLTFLALSDTDYRVRLSAIRALKEQDYNLSKAALLKALSDVHPHVSLTAAEILAGKNLETSDTFWQAAGMQPDWRTRAVLLGASLKSSKNPEPIRQHITSLYQKSENVYEKGALLTALSNQPDSYGFLKTETFGATNPVISTYGIEALATLRKQPDFPESLKTDFNELLKKAIASSDVAIIGTAATLIREPALNFRQTFTDVEFLKTAMAKLTLPRDVEPYIELQKTVAYLLQKPEPEAPKSPGQPLDWQLLQGLNKDQKVLLKTSKGDIILKLYVEDAPGSAANFVQLLEKGFYNGRFFHRVVPNFVAQAGDPRGDGWGGTDYNIRSEFADLHYLEGTVGMASAGKDTESCQWFITHTITPHLDGRYSIFAGVVSGLDVLHKLQIGDKIEKAELVKNKRNQ